MNIFLDKDIVTNELVDKLKGQHRVWLYTSHALEVKSKIDINSVQWLSALSEDAFASNEEEQLIKAYSRLQGPKAFLTSKAKLQNATQGIFSVDNFFSESNEAKNTLQFVDLKAQIDVFRPQLERAVLSCIESTNFIKGPEHMQLEKVLTEYVGAEAIPCGSGTDALYISLWALGVKPGDEIIVPDFTFFATAECVSVVGAKPIFCDVDPVTFNIDSKKIEALITSKTVGIIPVSLYGQCVDFDSINVLAKKHKLWVMEDGAQSFGATYKGKKSCSHTTVATTSFFPAKPLGCYGDGGAIFTNDKDLAEKIRFIANHGQNKRYHHKYIGVNGRLDTLQAAVLLTKLPSFNNELQARDNVARRYTELLKDIIATPVIETHNFSAWAQYTLRHEKRDTIIEHLKSKGIPTAIHYPIPLHRQEVYAPLACKDENFPVSVKLSKEVFSLPFHPFLKDEEILFIASAIKEALRVGK